jgi:hypothetical protein
MTTTVANIVGCSICGGLPPLCPTCEKLDRVLVMRPDEPLSEAWARGQDCPPEAKRVLLALLRKTDLQTGFTQLSLRHIARAVYDPTGDTGQVHVVEDDGSTHNVRVPLELTEPLLQHTLAQLRELVTVGLLETEPPLPADMPWVLRWLSRRTGTPEGMLWLRVRRRDAPAAWS